MSKLISVKRLLILINLVVRISCAPKIGPVLYDPLVYESQNSLKSEDKPAEDSSDDWLTAALRANNPTEEIPKKTCQGYDYDVTQCKYINDRKICGYNKNKGEPETEEIKDMGNGCRIRNNRLECGYLTGPFNPPRRPPANDEDSDKTENQKLRLSLSKTSKDLANIKKATDIEDPITLEDVDDIEVKTKNKLNKSTTVVTHFKMINTTSSVLTTDTNINKENIKQRKKYCVEKMDRIFCYTAES